MAMPYVQFGFNVIMNIYMMYLFYFWCVLLSVREIFPHLDQSHDEILIRYKGFGIVFSQKLEHSKN